MAANARLKLKRVYDPRAPDDGTRVLVDRLWPRGFSKAELSDAVWMKEISPSTELRKWFGHEPERWNEFRARYAKELAANPKLDDLAKLVAAGPVTLLYAARDRAHNEAVVIAEALEKRA